MRGSAVEGLKIDLNPFPNRKGARIMSMKKYVGMTALVLSAASALSANAAVIYTTANTIGEMQSLEYRVNPQTGTAWVILNFYDNRQVGGDSPDPALPLA